MKSIGEMIVGLFVVWMIIGLSAVSWAAPYVMNMQGSYTDDDGNPYPAGSRDMRFNITSSAGLPSRVLWQENVPDVTFDEDGVFNVLLGTTNPLNDERLTNFSLDSYWLQISVEDPPGSGSFDILSPKQRLVSVPMAMTARDVRGGDIIIGNNLNIRGEGRDNFLDKVFASDGLTIGQGSGNWDIYLNDDVIVGDQMIIGGRDGGIPPVTGHNDLGVTDDIIVGDDLTVGDLITASGLITGNDGGYFETSAARDGVQGEYIGTEVRRAGVRGRSVIGHGVKGTHGNYSPSISLTNYPLEGYLAHSSGYGVYGVAHDSDHVAVKGVNTTRSMGFEGSPVDVAAHGTGVEGEGLIGVRGYGYEKPGAQSYGVYGVHVSGSVGGAGTGVFGAYIGEDGLGPYGYIGGSANAVFGSSMADDAIYGDSFAVRAAGVRGVGRGNDGQGVYGEHFGNGHGVYGKTGDTDNKSGVFGEGPFRGVTGMSTDGIGVYGEGAYGGVTGMSTDGIGVYGASSAQHAIYGDTSAAGKVGIYGSFGGQTADPVHSAAIYGNGGRSGAPGVRGYAHSDKGVEGDSRNDYGVYGTSTTNHAVVGKATADGAAGVLGVRLGGAVPDTSTFSRTYGVIAIGGLGVQGNAYVTGTVRTDSLDRTDVTLDIAEWIQASDNSIEAGDVVVLDPQAHKKVAKSTVAYSTLVAGIVSTNPAFLAGGLVEEGVVGSSKEGMESKGYRMLALAGQVPTKVTTENGPIKVGDLLTSSSTPGHAMKATDPKIGTIVGKAMEPLESGNGKIVVLVTLQ